MLNRRYRVLTAVLLAMCGFVLSWVLIHHGWFARKLMEDTTVYADTDEGLTATNTTAFAFLHGASAHDIVDPQEREPAEHHDRNRQGPEPRGLCHCEAEAQRGCCNAQSQDDETCGERKSERLHGDLVGNS